MTYDDLYFAAVAGDTAQLRQLLSDGGKELLHVLIDGDDSGDGYESHFTVVFSILANMQGDVRYDVLDVLVEAGVSFNDAVILKKDGCTMVRPMLEYAISVWSDPKLVEYMLKNGAVPDAEHRETDIYGKISRTTMLWYALNSEKGNQMLELLLMYGADPEKCCEIYQEELDVYQYLPPLYYSLVENMDFSKTVCLIRYGASPQCGIDVGVGFRHNTNFKSYLDLNHPQMSKFLVQAFEQAQSGPAPRRLGGTERKPRETVPSGREILERAQSGTLNHKLNAGSRVTSMRRCYGKVTAYMFANFAVLALAFCVLGPLVIGGQGDTDVIVGMLALGVPCALIAAAIWTSVRNKAKKRGQDGVMPQFVADSVLMFVKVLLMMTIVLIPLVKSIGSNIQWEERKTTSGRSVMVKKTGDGTYEGTDGTKYEEKEY